VGRTSAPRSALDERGLASLELADHDHVEEFLVEFLEKRTGCIRNRRLLAAAHPA